MPFACCEVCGASFDSKTKLFKHLKAVNYHEEEGAQQQIATIELEKVALLYGYKSRVVEVIIPPSSSSSSTNNNDDSSIIWGDKVAQILLDTIFGMYKNDNNNTIIEEERSFFKHNRSFGITNRSNLVAQEANAGAVAEVLSTRVPKLLGENQDEAVSKWLVEVNKKLDKDTNTGIRLLGRLPVPKKFNAENDITSRRTEYLLPLDFICNSSNDRLLSKEFLMARLDNFHDLRDDGHRMKDDTDRVDVQILDFMVNLKKLMRKFSTVPQPIDLNDPAAIMEKKMNVQKRQKHKKLKNNKKQKRKNDVEDGENREDKEETVSVHTLGATVVERLNVYTNDMGSKKVLRRKRYHNFSPDAMAHEFLSFRRVDRFYVRSIERFSASILEDSSTTYPFLVLSVSGDLFLTQQVQRMVGLLLAIHRGLIHEEIIDCIFDEKYSSLVPAPDAPEIGLYSASVGYLTWEGKTDMVLSPRKSDRYTRGWNQTDVLATVEQWRSELRMFLAEQWLHNGYEQSSGRLCVEKDWTERTLMPWVIKARSQLEDYRRWKKDAQTQLITTFKEENSSPSTSLLPPLEVLDKTVPDLYREVLVYLREANESGLWPTTTLKRQLVMLSTDEENGNTEALSLAHFRAKTMKKDGQASAYSFKEGQGGASGSFSIGAMPGDKCEQPKGNQLFPKLMKAAFELERKLYPDRASSTIAINRNAQFRPHTDSGAGAGQSTSLIVALGDFQGGQLVVEGNLYDIRYKPREFNGWTQRHWTQPFTGERFSLVWFTPKGCEGLRGIDLCVK